MIPSASGSSSSRPPANNDRPIDPTPIAQAVKLVCQGQAELVSPVQSAEKKPVRDSSVAGPKPPGDGRKNRIAAMKDQKQQRTAELTQNIQKYLGQQEQMQKRVDVTYNVMLSKQNDPSCSEQERAKFRQRYVVELDTQSTSYVTLLAETRKLDELRVDPYTTQLQCDLLNSLVNNVRALIAIAGLDLEATERNYPHSNSNALQIYTAMHTEGTVVVDGLLEYMGKSSEIYETLIKLHEEVGNLLHELKSMSPQGAKAWQRLTSNRPDNQATALRTRFNQVVTLPTLSAKVPGSDTSAALFSAIEPLLLLSTSHIELQALQHYESGDRIAVLDNLIEHYDTAKLGLTSIGIFRTEELQLAPFSRLCEIVGQLHDDAERRLADELQNLADSERSSPKSTADQLPANRPSSSPSRKRVIKTVNGAMIGDVRPRVAKQGADIVDIKSPFEDQPLASFHEHKPNAWVEIEKARTPAPKPRATPYPQLMGDARKALAKIDELMQKFEGYARGTSHPKGIEESLQNTAKNLIDYADRLKDHEHTPPNSQNDAAFVSKLRGQAQTINDKATQLRTKMSLAQAPTSAAVEYLLSRNEIHPQKNGERIQLKTGRQDFLQEYVLLNRENRPLWYAHFHYETLNSDDVDYTAASLKTKEQRFATNATALAKAQTPHQKIDIYRGHIDKELATKLFLLL
ncbi:hypothetical protein ACCD00_11975 [Pseudomonas sp. Pseusp3]|jgi:hypothetical protein|uniref:hypothetical protein n=1 Tax=Pseudomonas sp. Pseusp3 TaxID=3243029 RepID=UPI0039AF46E9